MNNPKTKNAPKSKQTINVHVVETTTARSKKGSKRRKSKSNANQTALTLHAPQGGAYNTFVPMTSFVTKAGSTPGGMRVQGRVLISTLSTNATTVFQVVSNLNFNPLNIPRLSSFAPAFEQFFFHKTRFMFQSSQPTTAAGAVMIAMDYDAKDNNPTNTQAMMRNASSSMSNVYANNYIIAEPDYSRLKRFNVTEDTVTDNNQIYQGELIVAAEGCPVSTTIGYLLVEFDCEFFIPQ